MTAAFSALATLVVSAGLSPAGAAEPLRLPAIVVTRTGAATESAATPGGPTVSVWLDGADELRPGTYPSVFVRADEDAYVVVLRIDTDGRREILLPATPYGAQLVRARRTRRVDRFASGAFRVESVPGIGYVFAIASWEPFARDAYSVAADLRFSGSRLRGDPFADVERFAERLLGDARSGFSLAYEPYYVRGHHDYPRFLCYECHGAWVRHGWDPYAHACRDYRVIVFGGGRPRHRDRWRITSHDGRRWPRYEIERRVARDDGTIPFVEHRERDVLDFPADGRPAEVGAEDDGIVVRQRTAGARASDVPPRAGEAAKLRAPASAGAEGAAVIRVPARPARVERRPERTGSGGAPASKLARPRGP